MQAEVERCPIQVRDIGHIVGGSRDKPYLRCGFVKGHDLWHRFDAGRVYWLNRRAKEPK